MESVHDIAADNGNLTTEVQAAKGGISGVPMVSHLAAAWGWQTTWVAPLPR